MKNDKRKKFLNDLLKSYKNNKLLKITQGKHFLDYVHVNDICFLLNKIIIVFGCGVERDNEFIKIKKYI